MRLATTRNKAERGAAGAPGMGGAGRATLLLTVAFLAVSAPATAQVNSPPPPRGAERAIGDVRRPIGSGSVDADALESLRAEALAAGLTESQARALGDRVKRAAAARLPWHPLLDRMRQGLAKGAPYERIDAVCAGLEARLTTGAALVDDAFPGTDVRRPIGGRTELIDHTAFALEKGVEPTSLTTMFTTLRADAASVSTAADRAPSVEPGALTAPVVVLTSLTAAGVPATESVALVTEAWHNGVRDGEMEGLGLTLSQAIRNGEPRQVVMDTCARFRQREPARQILGDLEKRFGPVVRRGGPAGPGGHMNPGGNGSVRRPPPPPGRPGGGGPGPGRPGFGDGHGGNSGPGGDQGRPRPPRRPGGGGGTGGSGTGGSGTGA